MTAARCWTEPDFSSCAQEAAQLTCHSVVFSPKLLSDEFQSVWETGLSPALGSDPVSVESLLKQRDSACRNIQRRSSGLKLR